MIDVVEAGSLEGDLDPVQSYERIVVTARDRSPRLRPAGQVPELDAQDRRLDLVEAAVEPDLCVVGHDHPAVAAGTQILRREKTERAQGSERPYHSAVDRRAYRLRAVLDD